jgi:hypothetical protein
MTEKIEDYIEDLSFGKFDFNHLFSPYKELAINHIYIFANSIDFLYLYTKLANIGIAETVKVSAVYSQQICGTTNQNPVLCDLLSKVGKQRLNLCSFQPMPHCHHAPNLIVLKYMSGQAIAVKIIFFSGNFDSLSMDGESVKNFTFHLTLQETGEHGHLNFFVPPKSHSSHAPFSVWHTH